MYQGYQLEAPILNSQTSRPTYLPARRGDDNTFYRLGVKSMLCQVENMWPSWLNVLFNQFCSICLNLRRHHSHTLQNSLYCFYQHSLQSPSQFPFPIILVQVHLDFIFQRKGFFPPPPELIGLPKRFSGFFNFELPVLECNQYLDLLVNLYSQSWSNLLIAENDNHRQMARCCVFLNQGKSTQQASTLVVFCGQWAWPVHSCFLGMYHISDMVATKVLACSDRFKLVFKPNYGLLPVHQDQWTSYWEFRRKDAKYKFNPWNHSWIFYQITLSCNDMRTGITWSSNFLQYFC